MSSVDGLAIVISGPPAVGKTSVSGIVAKHLPLSSVLSVDEFRHLVIGGKTRVFEPDGALQGELAWRNALFAAQTFLENGFSVIIDDVMEHEEEWHLVDSSLCRHARKIYQFLLLASPQELESRMVRRGEEDDRMLGRIAELCEVFESPKEWRGRVIDTSNKSTDVVARCVLREILREGSGGGASIQRGGWRLD